MLVIDRKTGKTIGKVIEICDEYKRVKRENGNISLIYPEDEMWLFNVVPECKVISMTNDVLFHGTFNECRQFCRDRWTLGKYGAEFLVRDCCTWVVNLNSYVAQITCEAM